MKLRWLSFVIASVVFAASAIGQYHAAGYFGVTWAVGGTAYGVKVDGLGNVTTMALGTQTLHTCEIAADNHGVLVVDTPSGSIWYVDPVTMAVTGTLVTSPLLKRFTYGLEYDDNGDLYILNPTEVLRYSASRTLTTATSGLFASANQGFDILTGDLLVAASGVLWRVDRVTGWQNSIASGFLTRYGDIAQDGLSGDLYVSTCCDAPAGGRTLDRLPRGASTALRYLQDANMVGAHGPNVDRLSAGARRIIAASARTSSVPLSGGFWRIDLATKVPTKIAKYDPAVITDVAILGSRNIVSTRASTGRYGVDIYFPAGGNRPYAVAMSLTGVAPSLPLPDGRLVPLVIDDLALLSVRGLLAPFATNTIGTLNAGRAQVQLDVSSLYPAVKSNKVWLVAATLDPAAPLGISTISDPHLIKFD